MMGSVRTRWAAVGAAVAVTLGVGGLASVGATVTSGGRPVLIPVEPCRLVDTRPAPDTVGTRNTPLGPGVTDTVAARGIVGNCDLPSDATALALNVTALGATAATFLTIWPTGIDQPIVSSLNPAPGQGPVPNAVTTGLSPSGTFDVFNLAGSVDLLIDVVGYYADHNHDDRYYTKQDSDARYASAPPRSSYQPHMLDYTPDAGSSWTLTAGWTHAASTSECLYAPYRLEAGSVVHDVTIEYAANAPVTAAVALVSLRTTPGPAGVGAARRHVYNTLTLPSTGGQIAPAVVTDDPTDNYAGLLATPVPGDDADVLMAFCTTSVVNIVSTRANVG